MADCARKRPFVQQSSVLGPQAVRVAEVPDFNVQSNGYMNYVEDFRRMVEHIHSSYPDSSLYAVGHSFGSNTLVRYLGMCGANNVDSPIKGAVSVCNPFDF
jgi:predicted alpha/beta-fold hydrolase